MPISYNSQVSKNCFITLIIFLGQLSILQADAVFYRTLKPVDNNHKEFIKTIYDIEQDKHHNLWLATSSGLFIYNGTDYSIVENIKEFVFKLYIKDNFIWLLTNKSVHRMNKEGDINFSLPLSTIDPSIHSNLDSDFAVDSSGKIWIKSNKKLFAYNISSKKTQTIHTFSGSRNILNLKGDRIYFSDANTIYSVDIFSLLQESRVVNNIASIVAINQLDKNTMLVATSSASNGNAVTVSSMSLPKFILGKTKQFSDCNIMQAQKSNIIKFSDYLIVLCSNRLLILDQQLKHVAETLRPTDATKFEPQTAYADNNYFWLFTRKKGLYIASKKSFYVNSFNQQQAHNRSFTQIVHYLNNYWFITNKKRDIVRLGPQVDDLKTYNLPQTSKPRKFLIHDGQLFVVTDVGLAQFLQNEKQFKLYRHNPDIQTNLRTAASLNSDTILLASQKQGLLSFDRKKNEYTVFGSGSIDFSGIKNNFLLSLFIDSKKNIWLYSKFNLLAKLRYPYRKLQYYDLVDFGINEISQVTELADGTVLASSDTGLYKIGNNTVVPFLPEAYQHANMVFHSIHEDQYRNLWLSYTEGIMRITRSGAANYFIPTDGIPGNFFYFDSAYQGEDSKLFYPTTLGIGVVSPQRNYPAPPSPTIRFDKITSMGNAQVEHDTQVDRPIRLAYENNNIALVFRSTNFTRPEHTRYRYKLNGRDKHWWYVAHNENRAFYSNLADGNYEFLVQANNAYNQWSDTISKKITILTPWWRNKLSIIVYLFISTLILSLVSFLVVKRLHNKRKMSRKISEQQSRLKLSLWASGNEMWEWMPQESKLYRSPDTQIYCLAEYLNSPLQKTLIHPDDLAPTLLSYSYHLFGFTDYYEAKYRVLTKDDAGIEQYRWVLDRGQVSDKDKNNDAVRMSGTVKDITDIISQSEKARLFGQTLEITLEGLMILNPSLRVKVVNTALLNMLNLRESEAINQPVETLQFVQDNPNFLESIKKLTNQHPFWQGELWLTTVHSNAFPVDVRVNAVFNENGVIMDYLGFFINATDRMRSQREVERLSHYDSLTNIPNQSYFTESLNQFCQDNMHSQSLAAVAAINIIDFRLINVLKGDSEGDELLKKIAYTLGDLIANNGLISRFSADKFYILLSNCSSFSEIDSIVQELPLKLAALSPVDTFEELKTNTGVALFHKDATTASALIQCADVAMHHAKQHHRKTVYYDNSMQQKAHHRITLENKLREAIRKEYFIMHYQPRVKVSTNQIVGAEALIRWQDGDRLVFPNEFIPLAEEVGLIEKIDELVMRLVCQQIQLWHSRGLGQQRISINVSAEQFTKNRLLPMINDMEAEFNLPLSCLELELTESMLLKDINNANRVMKNLQERGILFAMDDFGTGYSSLNYLMDLMVNIIKIDRSFVHKCGENKRKQGMVKTIATMAQSLSLTTVAEGVESEGDKKIITEFGCSEYQGYLFSRPLAADDFFDLYSSTLEINTD